MENSLTAPQQSGRSPTASEQNRQLTNKIPAHPNPRKKPFRCERRAQQKPAVAAIRQPTPNPTHLTAQMGSPPLLIHAASAASTAAPTAAALRQPAATACICFLRLSCGVLLLFARCGVGLLLLFNISFIKKSPRILRLFYRICGVKRFDSLTGSFLLILFACCPMRRLDASAVVLLLHKKITPHPVSVLQDMRGEAL